MGPHGGRTAAPRSPTSPGPPSRRKGTLEAGRPRCRSCGGVARWRRRRADGSSSCAGRRVREVASDRCLRRRTRGGPARVLYGSYPPGGGRGGLARQRARGTRRGKRAATPRAARGHAGSRRTVRGLRAGPAPRPPVWSRSAYARCGRCTSISCRPCRETAPRRGSSTTCNSVARGVDSAIVLDLAARRPRTRRTWLVLTSRNDLAAPGRELGVSPASRSRGLAPLEQVGCHGRAGGRAGTRAVGPTRLGAGRWRPPVATPLLPARDGPGDRAAAAARAAGGAPRRRPPACGASSCRRPSGTSSKSDSARYSEGTAPLLDVGALLGSSSTPDGRGGTGPDLLETSCRRWAPSSGAPASSGPRRTATSDSTTTRSGGAPRRDAGARPRVPRAHRARARDTPPRGRARGRRPARAPPSPVSPSMHCGAETGLGHRHVRPALAFLAARHEVRELLDLCDLALAAEPAPEPQLRGEVLHRRVHACHTLGLTDQYVASVDRLYDAARAAGDPEFDGARAARARRARHQAGRSGGRPQLAAAPPSCSHGGWTGPRSSRPRSWHSRPCPPRGSLPNGARARRRGPTPGPQGGDASARLARSSSWRATARSSEPADPIDRLEAGLARLTPELRQGWRLQTRAFGMRGNVYYALSRSRKPGRARGKRPGTAHRRPPVRRASRTSTTWRHCSRSGSWVTPSPAWSRRSAWQPSGRRAQGHGVDRQPGRRPPPHRRPGRRGAPPAACPGSDTAPATSTSRAASFHDLATLKECPRRRRRDAEERRASLALREAGGKEGLAASQLQIGGVLTRTSCRVTPRRAFGQPSSPPPRRGRSCSARGPPSGLRSSEPNFEPTWSPPRAPPSSMRSRCSCSAIEPEAKDTSRHLEEARSAFEAAAATPSRRRKRAGPCARAVPRPCSSARCPEGTADARDRGRLGTSADTPAPNRLS